MGRAAWQGVCWSHDGRGCKARILRVGMGTPGRPRGSLWLGSLWVWGSCGCGTGLCWPLYERLCVSMCLWVSVSPCTSDFASWSFEFPSHGRSFSLMMCFITQPPPRPLPRSGYSRKGPALPLPGCLDSSSATRWGGVEVQSRGLLQGTEEGLLSPLGSKTKGPDGLCSPSPWQSPQGPVQLCSFLRSRQNAHRNTRLS